MKPQATDNRPKWPSFSEAEAIAHYDRLKDFKYTGERIPRKSAIAVKDMIEGGNESAIDHVLKGTYGRFTGDE